MYQEGVARLFWAAMKTSLSLSCVLAASAILAGCGGGGSGSLSSPVGARSTVGVFITDAVGAYDHVWVTIHKVELVGDKGVITLFDDSAGKVIDLVSLNHAGQQQFALLGVQSVPAGSFSQARFHLASTVTLFPTGSPTGVTKPFDDLAAGEKVLNLPLATSGKDVVADFDISKWHDNGDTVTAVVVSGQSAKVSGNSQADQQFKGSLALLSGTAPNFAFDLSGPSGTLHVVTNDKTAITNGDGSPSPVLVNGEPVEVEGTVDATTKTITALTVKVENAETEAEAEAKGTVSTIGTDTFTLTVATTKGFQPANTTVTINVDASTVFSSEGGVSLTHDEFFAALTAGAKSEAEGTFDPTSNTLKAAKVSVENEAENEQGHEIQIIGPASAVDSSAGTLTITVQKWDGTVLSAGSTVNIVTNSQTDLRGITLATIKAGDSLEVRGPIANGTLTAVRLRANTSGGNGGSGSGGNGQGGDDGG
jgi:hypothetical protein